LTYEVGRGWTHSDENLRIGPTDLTGIEKYGPSRCANTDSPEALLATGAVPGTQDVDAALTKVLRDGLVTTLFGARAMAVGGMPRDIVTGTPPGRGATILIAEDSCIPLDPTAPLVTLDLRGYPVHGPDGVAVVFLAGTLGADARRPVLDSIRVSR
jgi:hypothetical protein